MLPDADDEDHDDNDEDDGGDDRDDGYLPHDEAGGCNRPAIFTSHTQLYICVYIPPPWPIKGVGLLGHDEAMDSAGGREFEPRPGH